MRHNSYLGPGLLGVDGDSHDGRGRRVVATRRIAKDALLVVWGGDVMTRRQLERNRSLRHLTLQIDEDAFLVSTAEGPADWVNHSCSPNAGLRGQVSLVAMRAIERGEEVSFDYAMSDGCDYDEFECCCGSPICRGMVRGDDWGRPELIERYAGYRSPYLDGRIERLLAGGRRQRGRRGDRTGRGSGKGGHPWPS